MIVFASDTLRYISEVKIIHARYSYFSEDKKITRLDSSDILHNGSSNLGEILSSLTSVNIPLYGSSGSLATISLRGSGTNHTSVVWNGFPINSITTGSVDLSLIPGDFFEEIFIAHGASGSVYGSGTFGGSVVIKNTPNWSRKYNVELAGEYGSFGYKNYKIRALLGNSGIQYKIHGFYNTSVYDFPFRDTEKFGQPQLTLFHNSLKNTGIIQNCYIKLGKNNNIDLGIWYQVKRKEIPEIMGSYGQSNQVQQDSTFKSYVRWSKLFRQSSLEIKTAYLSDYLRYTDKNKKSDLYYSIDSRMNSGMILGDINYRYYINHYFTLDIGGINSFYYVKTNNYTGKETENHTDIFTGVKFKHSGIATNFTLRKIFTKYEDPGLLYSLGFNYQIINRRLFLRANLSNKFRTPSFNEKYWNPGGNPDLQPEKGWGGDLGIGCSVFGQKPGKPRLKLDLNFYTNKIKNWIQWIPESEFWYPENRKLVWVRGLETELDFAHQLGPCKIHLKSSYSFTKSTNEEIENNKNFIGNQLRYIPEHSANGSLIIGYKIYTIAWHYRFTGLRYTTEDNNRAFKMDPYNVSDLILSVTLGKKMAKSSIQLKVKNLFNEEYQVVKSYAMPGRAFYLSLKFGVGKDH
jgi:vitamin B12 transporter